MDYTLAMQRRDIADAISTCDQILQEAAHQKEVLTRAFNSIDENQEDILKSGSLLAQETREIMLKLINNSNK